MQKKIAYGGMGTALCVLLILGSAYLPTGKAALLFMASFAVYLLTLCTDKKTALVCYGAASLLVFFITSFANPLITVSFVLCFGNYPVLKILLDSLRFIIATVIKIIVYTVYFFVVYFAVTMLFDVSVPYGLPLLYPVGALAFAFYDILLLHTGKYVVARFFKRF